MTTARTITDISELASYGDRWDELVLASPRPSLFMLRSYLEEWWAQYGDCPLRVHVVEDDGRLMAALPLCVDRTAGLRVLRFVGGPSSALGDILLAPDAPPATVSLLAERIGTARHDMADLLGVPQPSRLAAAIPPKALTFVPRVEAPVMEMPDGWEAAYRAKTNAKKRNTHGRKRRQLEKLGTVETVVARSPEEVDSALTDAFRLHLLRWEGRPDGSDFASERGQRFGRALGARLAADDRVRIVLLTLDGQAIAFHYFVLLRGVMNVYRLAFDPEYGRYSPGLLSTLDAIEVASDAGATMVEFLGGAERYKRELADRFEPLHQGLGLAATQRGRIAVLIRQAVIRGRQRLKESERVHKFWFEDVAPVRRRLEQVTGRGGVPVKRDDG